MDISKLNLKLDIMQQEATELLKELIQNKCINEDIPDSGFEMRSIRTLTKYFEKHDISEYEIFEPYENRGNLLVNIEGTKPNGRSLMYENHVDVVPVNEEGWSVDPFAAVEKDGFIWGRGALDMLLFTATQAVAFAHLVSSEWEPIDDFYFLAVADEEGGGEYGAKWLVENVPDKISSDYLISEFGGAKLETPKGSKTGLMIAEKGPAWTKIKVKGKPGHGSMPYKSDNALAILSKIITTIESNPPEVYLTESWKEFIRELELGFLSRFLLTHKSTVNLALKMAERSDPDLVKGLYSLTRMTIAPTTSHAGNKVNIIPDEAVASFDIRTLPGQDWAYVKNYFKSTLGDLWDIVELSKVQYQEGSQDTWDSDLIRSIQKVHSTISNSEITPIMLPAVTDARFFRKLGTKCYGFCELSDEIDLNQLTDMVHGNDERVPIEAINQSTEFFVKLAIGFL